MDLEKFKIFISHHHSDAKEIKEGLSFLNNFGLELFIAHYDTEEGKDFVETIDKEIESCDLFLYFCTEEANNSQYCQQELGMAKGLGKDIIKNIILINNFGDDKDKANPMGMFAHKQAYRFKDFPSLIETIFDNGTVKDFFKEQFKKNNIIIPDSTTPYFEKIGKDNWNDFRFRTIIEVKHPLIKDEDGISIKVAYKGQNEGESEHSFDRLPKFFPYLSENFFSYIPDYDISKLEGNQEKILHLLNDVRVIEEEKFDKIKKEQAYSSSICRKIFSTDFISMEEPRETYNEKRKIYNRQK